jgi:hypothetical protein
MSDKELEKQDMSEFEKALAMQKERVELGNLIQNFSTVETTSDKVEQQQEQQDNIEEINLKDVELIDETSSNKINNDVNKTIDPMIAFQSNNSVPINESSNIDDLVEINVDSSPEKFVKKKKEKAKKDKWILYYTPEGYPYYFNAAKNESVWAEYEETDSTVIKKPRVTNSTPRIDDNTTPRLEEAREEEKKKKKENKTNAEDESSSSNSSSSESESSSDDDSSDSDNSESSYSSNSESEDDEVQEDEEKITNFKEYLKTKTGSDELKHAVIDESNKEYIRKDKSKKSKSKKSSNVEEVKSPPVEIMKTIKSLLPVDMNLASWMPSLNSPIKSGPLPPDAAAALIENISISARSAGAVVTPRTAESSSEEEDSDDEDEDENSKKSIDGIEDKEVKKKKKKIKKRKSVANADAPTWLGLLTLTWSNVTIVVDTYMPSSGVVYMTLSQIPEQVTAATITAIPIVQSSVRELSRNAVNVSQQITTVAVERGVPMFNTITEQTVQASRAMTIAIADKASPYIAMCQPGVNNINSRLLLDDVGNPTAEPVLQSMSRSASDTLLPVLSATYATAQWGYEQTRDRLAPYLLPFWDRIDSSLLSFVEGLGSINSTNTTDNTPSAPVETTSEVKDVKATIPLFENMAISPLKSPPILVEETPVIKSDIIENITSEGEDGWKSTEEVNQK